MFCQKCATQNADNSAFCLKCGTPMNAVTQQPAQQPVQQPMQQPVQQPVYAAPVQQPMQQPVYAAPAQQPYATPTKEKMSKGVLAAIIASIVVILAAAAVLLIVLLGGDDKNSGKKNDGDGGKVTTQKTNKNDKNNNSNDNDGFDLDLNGGDEEVADGTRPAATQNADAPATMSPEIEAYPMQNTPEDIANVVVYTLETYDLEVLIDSIPKDVLEYIASDNGFSSVREWQRNLEESSWAEQEEMEAAGYNQWFYWTGIWDDYANIDKIRAHYAEMFDLKVNDVKIVGIERGIEYYENGMWQTDYTNDEFYIIEIGGIWYIEGLDMFC